MVEACEPLKRWVSADAKYTRRLQEEISRFNRRKLDLADIVKTLEDERERHQQKVKKTSLKVAKIDSKVNS
jgi:predicted  nucleic acid-binding Zn-ribbon protein